MELENNNITSTVEKDETNLNWVLEIPLQQ